MKNNKISTCEEMINIALLESSNEASKTDVRRLHEHLKTCRACRREVDSMMMTVSSYRGSRLSMTPPSSTRTNIMVATTMNMKTVSHKKVALKSHILRLSLTAAATAAVVMFAFFGFIREPEESGQPGSDSMAELVRLAGSAQMPAPEETLNDLALDEIDEVNSMLDYVNASSGDDYKTTEELKREILLIFSDA